MLSGVGIQVTSSMGGFRIKNLLKNSPSELVSGSLRVGDLILAIDGQEVANKTLGQVTAMLTGPLNTKVTVEGQRDQKHTMNRYVVTMRRAGREGDTRPASEMCKEAVDAIKEMRKRTAETDQQEAEMRKLATALRDAQAAAKQHENNAKNLQEEVDKLKQQLGKTQEKVEEKEADLEQSRKASTEWQLRAQEREQKVHALAVDKQQLTKAFEKMTCEMQDSLREIELQRSALAAKADVERKLQRSILEAHEVRGELAKSRAQVAEGEIEIKRLTTELHVIKKLEADVADFKERLRVAHRRLTESEEEIMRLRPFEKSIPLLENKLQGKFFELTKTVESLNECQLNLEASGRREGELQFQLKSLNESSAATEADLRKQLAAATTRLQDLEKDQKAREDEVQQLSLQLQKCQLDLVSASDSIKQGLDREKIADQKNSLIQRSVTEQANRIAETEAKLQTAQATIDEKLPVLQKEVQQLYALAKEKQDALVKALSAVEATAEDMSKELERQKKIERLLQESQQREEQYIKELHACKSEIIMLKSTLESTEAEIHALQAELESKCKSLAATTTQMELATIKCNGLEREAVELKADIRSLKQEIEHLKSVMAVLQGKLTASESLNTDFTNKINLLMQEQRVDRDKVASLESQIAKLLDEITSLTQKLRKSEHQLSASEAHSADLTKQIHELKGTATRLEMRIRALEAEKGGITLEKGGLADQLAKLDVDFQELQTQLTDTRKALDGSKERESQLQALYDALQVLAFDLSART